jgi:hypothetical protein
MERGEFESDGVETVGTWGGGGGVMRGGAFTGAGELR